MRLHKQKLVESMFKKCLFISLVSVMIVTSGCSSVLSIVGLGSDNDLINISVEATHDCNRNTPVAMDFVFIQDESIAPLLAELNGPEWFTKKRELMMRYNTQLSLSSLEVVCLSALKTVSFPDNYKKAKSVLLFANYIGSNGQYVAELSQYTKLKIRLERETYKLLNEDK